VSFITMTRFEYEVAFLDSLRAGMDRVRPGRGSAVYLTHTPHYTSFVTIRGACARVWFDDPKLQLGTIGDYHAPESRPHAFLRFDAASHGFVHVPNEVMDAQLAAEKAMDERRPADARVEVERALSRLPASGPNLVRLDLLNNRGFACVALGDTSAARDSWRRALAIDPGFASAALNLARLDAPAGRLADARATLERLLVHAPADGEALSLLARVQRVQGDVAGAEATLARLAEVDPEGAARLETRAGEGPLPAAIGDR
jgi:tetratricopeptide (TPR) repeat protein